MTKEEIRPYLIVATSKGQAIFTKEELFELYDFTIVTEKYIITEIVYREKNGDYRYRQRLVNKKNIDKFGATIRYHQEWNTQDRCYWFIDQKEYEEMVKESEQILDKTQKEIERLKEYNIYLKESINRLKNINSENKLKK